MVNKQKDSKEDILDVDKNVKYKTVDNLLSQSHSGSVYYTLLLVSTLIIASGLLLSNGFIIIGGILIAPVLHPVLVVALGLAVGEIEPVKRVGFLLFKSLLVVILISFFLSLIIGPTQNIGIFENTMRTAILYFVVAISSGAAATFALVRKDVSEVLPGIAIAVSLVPPLSLMGIWLGAFDLTVVRYYVMVFAFNIIGVIVGSLVIFSLLKFYKTEKEVLKKTEEESQKEIADKVKQSKPSSD